MLPHLLVMICGGLKLPKEDVCIAQVTVRPPLGRLVPELFSDGEPFCVVGDGLSKVSEQVVCVAKVATGATLRRAVLELRHQAQVTCIVLHRLLQAVLHLVAETTRLLWPHPAQVLSLRVVHVAEIVQRAALAHLMTG